MPLTHPLRSKSAPAHRGFTLVELLVAIVIAGIIAGMVAIALSGAQRQALETRGQAFVDRMNLTMLQLYEEESRKSTGAPVSTPQRASTGFSQTQANEMNRNASKARALAQLNWKRDYLRCALPDRIQDLIDPPIFVYYPLRRGPYYMAPNAVARLDPTFDPPVTTPPGSPPAPTWTVAERAASLRWRTQERYRERVVSILQAVSSTPPANFAECVDGSTANGEWTPQFQGAECLYLIFATSIVNGVPAIDSLRTRDIGDVDEDGIPEILDPWGTPLGFLRWPAGYFLVPEWNVGSITPAELAARKVDLQKDTIDMLYSDPRFDDTSSTNHQADDPFALIPLVISAGGDRAFDIVGLDTPPSPPISYTTSTFPMTPSNSLVFPGTPTFIDPYQYGVSPPNQLGARQDTIESGIDNSADNILPSFDFS